MIALGVLEQSSTLAFAVNVCLVWLVTLAASAVVCHLMLYIRFTTKYFVVYPLVFYFGYCLGRYINTGEWL